MPKKPRRAQVREPIQVYLAPDDRDLLDRAAHASGESRAEIMRQGIRRMTAEILGEADPMLALLREMQARDWPADEPTDVSERHDEYLAAANLNRRESGTP